EGLRYRRPPAILDALLEFVGTHPVRGAARRIHGRRACHSWRRAAFISAKVKASRSGCSPISTRSRWSATTRAAPSPWRSSRRGPELGPPPHIHRHHDESFYVLDGTFEFSLAGRAFTAGPGSFVHLPKGVVHTHRAGG